MKVKVRCIQTYIDSEINERITNSSEDKNYERIVSKERASELVKAGVCSLIEQQEEQDEQQEQQEEQQEEQEEQEEQKQILETAKLEPDAETAVQKTKTSNKKTK